MNNFEYRKSLEVAEFIISESASQGFDINCRNIMNNGTLTDMPTLKSVYSVLGIAYRMAQAEGKILKVRDLYSTLTVELNELYKILDCQAEAKVNDIEFIRLRKARRQKKSGEPQFKKVRQYDPRTLRPYERTW
jgi:hypothetical protein